MLNRENCLFGAIFMELSERKKIILRTIVDRYVETAEPVGSKVVVADCGLPISSATIRNEMAELEAMGLLEQPHTSAGRIPTSLGYRVYVNELMERQRLSLEDTEMINQALRNKVQQLDKILTEAGRLTSQLTNYPAYALASAVNQVTIVRFDFIHIDPHTFIIVAVLSDDSVKNKLVRLHYEVSADKLTVLSNIFNARFTGLHEDEITPALIRSTERSIEDNLGLVAIAAGFSIEVLMVSQAHDTFLTGTSHLLEHPEFRDIDKAQRVLKYLSDEKELLKLPTPDAFGAPRITIGPENLAEELKDSSVIVARFNAGENMEGILGIVGPTRMDYTKVAARLSYIAQGLSWLLSGGFTLMGGDNNPHLK